MKIGQEPVSLVQHKSNPPVHEAAALARFVSWVRGAAPYIHAFRNRTFVIAFGGDVMQMDRAQRLAYDFNLLAALGIRLVLVHGARPQIDAEMARRGLVSQFHNDLRVTDADAMECVKAGMAVTRIEIEALLSQGLPNTPMAGSYMRVTGGNYVIARPLGVIDGVDLQYTGTVRRIIADEIQADLDQQNVVLISPLGLSPSGEIFNLTLEEVAGAVAEALKAEKLVFICSGDGLGLHNGQGCLNSSVTADEAERILSEGPEVAEDLRLFVPYAVRAVRRGVSRAHLISFDADGGLLLEFFTHRGVGTVISRDPLFRLRDASAEDVGALVSLITPMEADGTLVRRGRELLEQEIDRFLLAELDGVLVGCAALYPFHDEPAAELACLAVAPEFRRSGVGDLLLARIEQRAKKLAIRTLYVLTTRTAHWFHERGFAETLPDALPDEKRQLYNFKRRSKVFAKQL